MSNCKKTCELQKLWKSVKVAVCPECQIGKTQRSEL